ncbi:MAG: Ig-like domain-containing protein, partial [Odoribacteraceae bacterium]|nr:Ig-like domain-containing protein [Odoribacteraceae bacterium]
TLVADGCANKGFPEGGPKDEAPPFVTSERPSSFTTGFREKRVSIYFNEYVQLRDINSKFIMSPPAKKAARVNQRGKYVLVEFQDTLREETTYSLDFGNAIVDNNEGNPLGFYRYVFSTGSVIDTMELAGQVIDARTRLPLLGVTVALYANTADSAALVELPAYVARTDSAGMFRVTNAREQAYRVVAIDDTNRDYLFTPEEERVGFLDSLVTPVVWHETRMDTIRPDTLEVRVRPERGKGAVVEVLSRDTVVEREYVMFGPSNLQVVMFEEKRTQLYLTGEARPERERLEFTFSVPRENNLKVSLLEGETEDWYLVERSAGHDTLSLWIRDSTVYKRDSLGAVLEYLYTDSLQHVVTRRDTTMFAFAEKETTGRRARKDEEETEVPTMKFLEVKSLSGASQDLHRPVVLDFNKPVGGEVALTLQEKVDTTWREVKFRLSWDSLKIRRARVEYPWKPGTEYLLSADSATIHDIHGLHNRRVEVKFSTKEEDAYGKVLLNVTGVTGPMIFQLCQGDKEVKVVEERRADKDGRVAFEYLNEGTYTLRAVVDGNGNGKWDTGHFLERRQPEEIRYFPEEFKVRPNFDIEQDVDASKNVAREDPAKKKKDQNNRTNQ